MNTVIRKFRYPDACLKNNPRGAINFAARPCRSIPALLAALAFAPAHADIYLWHEADGAKRMSNLAPAWYSSSAPGRVRTQVLVNGYLVDDTGVPQQDRERLQATRAKAEAWGQPSPPPTPLATVQPPPRDEGNARPTKTAATAAAEGIPAQALEGFKSVFEAKKLGESVIEEMNRQNRPR